MSEEKTKSLWGNLGYGSATKKASKPSRRTESIQAQAPPEPIPVASAGDVKWGTYQEPGINWYGNTGTNVVFNTIPYDSEQKELEIEEDSDVTVIKKLAELAQLKKRNDLKNYYSRKGVIVDEQELDAAESKPAKKQAVKINKSEEVFINYNELADGLAIEELTKKHGEYDEVKMLGEYLELIEKYKKIILKYERSTE